MLKFFMSVPNHAQALSAHPEITNNYPDSRQTISQANIQFFNLNQQNIFKQDLIYVTNSTQFEKVVHCDSGLSAYRLRRFRGKKSQVHG
jgi:hypothetical protein